MSLIASLKARFRLRDSGDLLAELFAAHDCRVALDIGCGPTSALSRFRPHVRTFGVDASAEAVAAAQAAGAHDRYLVADILKLSSGELLEQAGVERFDVVTLFDVIEHVPKRLGWELLERCEALTGKFVVLQTPCGFVEQGPEFGNEYQRHLSGWFVQDLEGLGYTVKGTSGCRWFHGYAGAYRPAWPGMKYLDVLAGHLLRTYHRPQRAFNLLAYKDVRGVPARLGNRLPPNERNTL
jgi:hypothetical protein